MLQLCGQQTEFCCLLLFREIYDDDSKAAPRASKALVKGKRSCPDRASRGSSSLFCCVSKRRAVWTTSSIKHPLYSDLLPHRRLHAEHLATPMSLLVRAITLSYKLAKATFTSALHMLVRMGHHCSAMLAVVYTVPVGCRRSIKIIVWRTLWQSSLPFALVRRDRRLCHVDEQEGETYEMNVEIPFHGNKHKAFTFLSLYPSLFFNIEHSSFWRRTGHSSKRLWGARKKLPLQ